MIQYFFEGGLFMWLLCILLIVNLILIGKKSMETPGRQPADVVGIHAILFIGVSSAALGMFGQILGLLEGFKAMLTATDLNPAIVERGFSISFHSTIFGFLIYFLSAAAWFLLFRRHTRSLKLKA